MVSGGQVAVPMMYRYDNLGFVFNIGRGVRALVSLAAAVAESDAPRRALVARPVLSLLLRHVLRASQVTPASSMQPQAPLRQTLQLLRHPGIARLMLVNWLISSSWDVHSLVVPFIGVARGLSASQIGMILGAFALATGLVRLLLPLLAERVSEWALISGSMLVNCALFVLYPMLPSALAMGLCSFLMGVALGVVVGVALAFA
jgi:predicted MFS family arabinose efflux permease